MFKFESFKTLNCSECLKCFRFLLQQSELMYRMLQQVRTVVKFNQVKTLYSISVFSLLEKNM